jgi:hypothetical protein
MLIAPFVHIIENDVGGSNSLAAFLWEVSGRVQRSGVVEVGEGVNPPHLPSR